MVAIFASIYDIVTGGDSKFCTQLTTKEIGSNMNLFLPIIYDTIQSSVSATISNLEPTQIMTGTPIKIVFENYNSDIWSEPSNSSGWTQRVNAEVEIYNLANFNKDIPVNKNFSVRIRKLPFKQGGMRKCFYLQNLDNQTRLVAKLFLNSSTIPEKERHLSDLEMQLNGLNLSYYFNLDLINKYFGNEKLPVVSFLPCWLYKIEGNYYFVEPFVESQHVILFNFFI